MGSTANEYAQLVVLEAGQTPNLTAIFDDTVQLWQCPELKTVE